MNTEQLKVIAEGMGYARSYVVSHSKSGVTAAKGEYDPAKEYNPLTNNDQMVEIIEKLKLDIVFDDESNLWEAIYPKIDGGSDFESGETIRESVCNAAYEYFKEE